MNHNEKVNQLLQKRYKSLVETSVKSDATVKGKVELFKSNQQALDRSIKRSLENVEKNITAIDKRYDDLKATVENTLREKMTQVAQARTDHDANFDAQHQEAHDRLENKYELNELKKEKLDNDYDHKSNTAAQAKLDTQQRSEDTIEAAMKEHNDFMSELIEEINARHENNNTIETEANQAFDTTHKRIESARQRRINDLENEKQAYLENLKSSVSALETSFKEERAPLLEEIEQLDAEYDKAIQAIEKDYDQSIAKHENYKKESEKINDSDNVSAYEKKIKDLKKRKSQALEDKRTEREATIKPEKDKLERFDQNYAEKMEQTKGDGCEGVADFLKRYDTIQNEQNIAIDEANTTLNKELARHQKEKENIELDRRLQTVNIDHTLEEKRAQSDHQQQTAGPTEELAVNEAAYEYNIAMSDLTRAKEIAEADHQKSIDTIQEMRTFEHDKLSQLAKKLNAYSTYDTHHIDIEKRRRLHTLDYNHEAMLAGHYFTHSENYAAYKNEPVNDRKPFMDKLINTKLKEKTDMYNAMLKSAEADHNTMVKEIEETFEAEKAIYERPYEVMREKHQRIIDELVAAQVQERNDILEKIGALNYSKDKKSIAKLKKHLSIRKHENGEALEAKKAELENTRKIYLDMIENLKKAKEQSIEEAQTLFYHYTDQINGAIEQAKDHAQQEMDAFYDTYYEIKHRAQLFKTFQRTRKQKTLDSANAYNRRRNQRLNDEQSKADNTLQQTLQTISSTLKQREEAYASTIKSIESTHQQTLEAIDTKKDEAYAHYKKVYEEEKNRLEKYLETLRRKHAQTMRELKTDFNTKKEKGFADKDANEKAYHEEINRLDDALEKEKARKENQREARAKEYTDQLNALLEWVKVDALKRLQSSDIYSIEPIIKGEQSLQSLSEQD